MKFNKLVVKGFMRFKEQQEISFPENQVTLIFGENGAGKTSLLDAICIGLYGRTFRTSFDPEAGFLKVSDLINHDSTKATIHMEFENYGHNFVVKREITRSAFSGEIIEDGEVKAEGEDVFDYVSNKALGLDWETFNKSTVILQGEMNSLTDALPSTRKQTFAKLFGLDKYGVYEEKVKEELEGKTTNVKELEAANKVLANEIAKIPQVEISMKPLSKTISKLEQQKASSKKKVQQLATVRRGIERDYKTYIKINEKIDGINTQISEIEKTLEREESDLKQLNALNKDFPSIRKSYDELSSVTKSLQKMKPLKAQYDKLDSKMATLQNSLKVKKDNLSDIQKDIAISKTILNNLKKQIPSSKKVQVVREEMALLERKKVELEENRYQISALLNIAQNTINELKTSMNRIKRKHACPVCSRKISDTRGILKHYAGEIRSLEADMKKKGAKLRAVSVELRKIDQKIAAVEVSKSKLESVYSKQGEFVEESKRLDVSMGKRDKLSREVVAISKAIAKLQQKMRSLRFNAKEYNVLEKRIGALRQEKVAEKFSSVGAQLKQLPKLQGEIKRIRYNLAKTEKQRKKLLTHVKKFKDVENKFNAIKEQLQSAQDVYDQNVVRLTKEKTNYSALTKQRTELKGNEKKLQKNEDEIERLREHMLAYEELALIFKDIPENILKRLVPHVEKESSAIITELSEGAISAVNIDAETLNISATTGGQERPIQYFSGGQQTRINMALRIAISRILSKMPHKEEQASAIVQTLFIDEGDFGNLDESGVRDTMGVIHNLTREFSRIVLISHLESVKSNFQGYTVEVTKTAPSESVISSSMEAVNVPGTV